MWEWPQLDGMDTNRQLLDVFSLSVYSIELSDASEYRPHTQSTKRRRKRVEFTQKTKNKGGERISHCVCFDVSFVQLHSQLSVLERQHMKIKERKKQLRIWLELLEKRDNSPTVENVKSFTNYSASSVNINLTLIQRHRNFNCVHKMKILWPPPPLKNIINAVWHHQHFQIQSNISLFLFVSIIGKKCEQEKKRKNKLFSFLGHRCLIFLENLVGCKGVQLAIDEFQTFHLILRHLIRLELAFTTR